MNAVISNLLTYFEIGDIIVSEEFKNMSNLILKDLARRGLTAAYQGTDIVADKPISATSIEGIIANLKKMGYTTSTSNYDGLIIYASAVKQLAQYAKTKAQQVVRSTYS